MSSVASSVSADVRELRPVTVPEFVAAKTRGRRLTMLTAYDYTMARLLDAAGVDSLLVGDSLGMVVQGQPDSLAVTLDEMVYHTRLVVRGVRRALVVADLPFMSYQVSPQQAVESAGRLIKEGGAHAVKLEGGVRSAEAIAAITNADIPLIGHIGLTPQSVRRLGGFKVQRDGDKLLEDALAVEAAGAFGMVVECVPAGDGGARHRRGQGADHRHRRRPRLRRSGAGDARSAGFVRRVASALRQALRRAGPGRHQRCRELLP
jgi:3-methyl-2-oxobutanoate hydroxymethyltransferase